ncbi:MAG: flavodoxin family protein [Oscillospiraceae bacterium]
MKVLLVNGSPHKNGSTNRALQEVEKTLQAAGVETEIFWIGNEPIGGCIGCGGCGKKGACVFGGVVAEFTEKAKAADGFVFGSPVHSCGGLRQYDVFLDRVFYSASAETFRFKLAAVVTAARRGGNSAAYEQLLKYPGISHMPIVSSQYWNMVHGANAQDVEQDLEGLQTMRALGRNMAWLLSCIEAGKDAGINPPAVEPFQRTNFIR